MTSRLSPENSPTAHAVGRVVLFADGEPPHHATALKILHSADAVICCDGAYLKARALNCEPAFVVGDCDSLPESSRAALGDRLIKVDEQETNDLAKAFRFARARFKDAEIAIVGATGLREDHTLGNIFRLTDFAREGSKTILYTDSGTFEPVLSERVFSCHPNTPVSLFAPYPDTHVSSSGLVWPLDGVPLDDLWSATLNRTSGVTFTLKTNRPILVFTPYAAS